jgi:uncharacterized RDD family membrane protein YckC
MVNESDRLAHIFIWKQGSTPNLEYARHVLSVVNPDALRVLREADPPIRFFTLGGQWPEDPWARALYDMRATPNPEGHEWTDINRYDLAGWQGTDQRTGERLFIVTAYRKANGSPADAFQIAPVPAPSHGPTAPVPQVPYYPQHPTGPLEWPPEVDTTDSITLPFQTQGTGPEAQDKPPTPPDHAGDLSADSAQQESGKAGRSGPARPGQPATGTATSYPPIYSRALGGQVPAVTGSDLLPNSYAPYYAGFPQRLLAALIDFFFMGVLVIAAVYAMLSLRGGAPTSDFGSWLAAYTPPALVGILIFALYHVVQWAAWGRTPGKYLLGIKVVASDGSKPELGRALVRMLGYFFSFFGGFLLIAFDPRRQGLHDKLAETYVVPEVPGAAVPRGLPGYSGPTRGPGVPARPQGALPGSTMAAATVAGDQAYETVEIAPGAFDTAGTGPIGDFRGVYADDEGLQTVTVLPDLPDDPFGAHTPTTTNFTTGILTTPTDLTGGPITGPLGTGQPSRRPGGYLVDRARELYRQGIEHMSRGIQPSARGYKIEAGAARLAALALKGAVELVPNSVLYRYFYGVALRYAEGFELAIGEFRRVLELDPSYYEARQQVAYGPRWHDPFAYTPWDPHTPIEVGGDLPGSLQALLPPGQDPVTRLALLSEGTSKVVAVLTRTPRSTWSKPLTPELPAHIDMMLSRTPHGPIIAFYLVVEDNPGDPYKGETFLNPHDPGYPTYDACQLGQNLVSQLSRQDHTYLIFVDENNKLLMSRKLEFDPQTQVKINHCMYEIQTLPAQAMDAPRFQQAAQWHMQNFALDQIK